MVHGDFILPCLLASCHIGSLLWAAGNTFDPHYKAVKIGNEKVQRLATIMLSRLRKFLYERRLKNIKLPTRKGQKKGRLGNE